MTEPRLRPMRAFDAPACAAIVNAWIDQTPWVPRLGPPEEVAWHLRAQVLIHDVTVAEVAREVAGFCAREGGTVRALYVAAPARGAGIGARLLDAAKAGRDALNLWTFQANTAARRFYARHGFTEGRTSAGDTLEHLPDVELTWTRAA